MAPSHDTIGTQPTSAQRRRLRSLRDFAEAAVELFERNGYAATTVEDIAAAADYSARTFFRLFSRKEDVLFYDLPDKMQELRLDSQSVEPEALWATIRAALIHNAQGWEDGDPAFVRARVHLFHDEPALTSRYLEYCLEWEDTIAQILAGHRGLGAESDVQTRLIAGSVVTAFRAAFRAKLTRDGSIANHLAHALDLLEAGPLGPLTTHS